MSNSPQLPARRNRRQRYRLRCNGQGKIECRCVPCLEDSDLTVCALDISESGVQLVLRTALATGAEVEVVLCGVDGRPPVKRLGRVAWSRPLADARTCAGVMFDMPIPFAEVQAFSRRTD